MDPRPEAPDAELLLRRDGSDLLILGAPAGARVQVVLGFDPDADEPLGAGLTAVGGAPIRVPAADLARRPYLSVRVGEAAPQRVAERILPLHGTQNFRDLGGYPAAGGLRVRWGRVFRADGLHALTAPDHAYLEGIGLDLVCDFRSDHEVEEDPNRLPDSASYERFPVEDASMQPRWIRERVEAGDVSGFDEAFMARGYVQLLENQAAHFGAVFERIAAPGARPLVYHCSAGKDRTGVMSALVLRALGVSEEVVVEDYVLTESATRRRIEMMKLLVRLRGGDPAGMAALMGARPGVIRVALEHVEREHGGIERYLVRKARVAPEAIEQLRENLLV